MPKPVDSEQRYMPGLDGLRALAVLAVIAYHVQFGWASGGLLGVGVFFTLSGFLITSLLLGQWRAEGRIRLGQFWIRRARRLLPAVFAMLAVVTAWVTIADRDRLAGLRGAVGAAAMYISNWFLIAQKQSYFAQFAPPAPLDHLWSLAVEEQFYLVWPLLMIGGLVLLRRLGAKAAWWLALPAAALAAASVFAMIHLYLPGLDPTRVYEGTDTRAFGLLIGAVLALAWPDRRMREPGRAVRLGLDGAAIAGLAVIGLMIWRVGEYSPFLYRGGMVVLSVATAAVVAATACPGSLIGLALGWRPLRWIGARSYGIYLWHYPVVVLTTPANATIDLKRAALQVAAAILLAAVSWQYLEEPIRHGAIERFWKRAQAARQARKAIAGTAVAGAAGVAALAGPGTGLAIKAEVPSGSGVADASTNETGSAADGTGPDDPRGPRGAIGAVSGMGRSGPVKIVGAVSAVSRICAAAAGVAVLALAVAGLTGVIPAAAGTGAGSAMTAGSQGMPVGGFGHATGGSGHATGGSGHATGPGDSGAAPGQAKAGTGASAGSGPRTSCASVVHIGDSTSYGLDKAPWIPDPSKRITAQYHDIGVQQVILEISGGRSIVEVLPGQVNAYDTAKALIAHGYRGCWVLALGTDDTANVAAGSSIGLMDRIQKMMAITAGAPVLWVNVKTQLSGSPYAEPNMLRWDAAVQAACARYPNMRIYDWASAVHTDWFVGDGIHYTPFGYQIRAKLIATALAQAFPADGKSPAGCLVSG